MAINRRFLANSAIQGACWALAWRTLLATASVAVISTILNVFVPEIALFIAIGTSVAAMWILLWFVYPAMIQLYRHYWRVFNLSVQAEPRLAMAIVTEQWANLRSDLTLPWRAIRG
jgi:hypothetical protein